MQSTGSHPELREPQYISVKETSQLLNLSRLSVYRRVHSGLFRSRKAGRSYSIYRPLIDAIKAEIDSCRSIDIDQFATTWNAQHDAEARVAS